MFFVTVYMFIMAVATSTWAMILDHLAKCTALDLSKGSELLSSLALEKDIMKLIIIFSD